MSIFVNGKEFSAEYLSTPEETSKGMMGRTTLDGCMVFKMGLGHHSFWMKGCLIPLDIVFVLKNKITHIHHDCPPPDPHRMNPPHYTGMGDYVIEFPGGTAKDWNIGDKVGIY